MKIFHKILCGALIPVIVLIIWSLVSYYGLVNTLILPSPLAVLKGLVSLFHTGGICNDIAWSLLRTLLGFALGVSLGIVLGAAMGTWRHVHNSAIFFVDALRSVPATSLFPLFMLFLGLGLKSMVALIAFPCCWLVTINTMYGVRNSSQIRRETGIAFKLGSLKRFFFITLPDAAPSIVASMRLSLAMCLHMAIIGEMFMGSQIGIGRRIYDAHMLLRVPEMYSLIFIAGILGYLINHVFVLVEKKIVFWGGK